LNPPSSKPRFYGVIRNNQSATSKPLSAISEFVSATHQSQKCLQDAAREPGMFERLWKKPVLTIGVTECRSH